MFLHKKSHRFFFNTIKICTQAAQQKILIQTSRHLARSILQNIAQYVQNDINLYDGVMYSGE